MPPASEAALPSRRPHPNPLRSNPSFGYSGGASDYRSQALAAKSSGVVTPSSGPSVLAGSRRHSCFSVAPTSSNDDNTDKVSPDSDDDDNTSIKMAERPPFHRPTNGRSGTPLLASENRGRTRVVYGDRSPSAHLSSQMSPLPLYANTRPQLSHSHHSFNSRHTLRSVSPASLAASGANSVRKKWTIAGVFLGLSLVSFCVQTELAKIVQTDLGWNKAYCMLYLTHGSWSFLFPTQLLILRLMKRSTPWAIFWRGHWKGILSTAWEVQHQKLSHSRRALALGLTEEKEVIKYVVRTTAIVTTSLTVAGLSWYIAVNMTTPSDLTAIYNCSAFFAYAFSVPLLKEPLRLDKSIAVMVAIVGVLVVAYGDGNESASLGDDKEDDSNKSPSGGSRFLGNLIIGVGSVLYGLYEVLYKRMACPPEGASASRSVIFANTFGGCIGLFTLTVLWIPLPILHWLGWETFEVPTGKTAWLLLASVVMNATFAGSFLVLISLTSPVLSSVAALLTIFMVALADWALTGEPLSGAAMFGGLLIVIAFGMLSWSTWREMSEHAEHRETEEEQGLTDSDSDSTEDDEEDAGTYSRDEEGRRMLR